MPTIFRFLVFTAALAGSAVAQQPPTMRPPESVAPMPPYARYADLVLAAPVIADATIRSISRLKPGEAPDLSPGTARLYVEADVTALIRAPAPLPPRVGYLIDVPLDASGRVPKLTKARVLLFARPAAQGDQIQLVGKEGQQAWSPGADALTRGIVKEVLAADAAPAIIGVGKAFHVPGALPGVGETQVFLRTANGKPVSLSINRAADGSRTWSVSLSEFVDAAAGPPRRDTLLWYRLACSLPATLPDASLTGSDPSDAAAAATDYGFVRDALGRCDRGDVL